MKYPTRELVVVVALLAACGDDDKATADAGAADAAGADAPLAVDASVADAAPPDAAPVCGNGSREDGEECDDGNTMAGDGCEDCQSVGVTPTAFRVTSLSVLDPHLMAEDAGCAKADLTEFVNALIEGSLTDQDGDQLLDFAPVMVFRPLAPDAASGEADFVIADCTATSPVTCRRGAAAPAAMTAQNQASASCLGPLADTTGGYTPPVGTTPGPCFVTAERSLSLSLSGIEIALVDAQIAATYVGTPPTSATGGLLRGFMTEAVADATVIPQLEGITLSALLPGSTSNGCPSDVDVVDGVRGWWFYLAFTAEAVAWTDDAPAASL
jgi:cysteine-rich repeat protein